MTAFVRIRVQRPQRLHFALCGDIGAAASGQLDQMLRIVTQARPRTIRVDLSEVTSFSEHGVEFLTALGEVADTGDADLTFDDAPACVQRAATDAGVELATR